MAIEYCSEFGGVVFSFYEEGACGGKRCISCTVGIAQVQGHVPKGGDVEFGRFWGIGRRREAGTLGVNMGVEEFICELKVSNRAKTSPS